ncbi:hypothetical protein O6H91_14G008000 [Diphasiastrum complanatum]|uniref:Uncharacterized protein n=2 Tax=Diphasiastrum complanatum TaxID=34168 RepID=A0ACC2BLB0_DIPCM|nr:hypothetical protein O6H91_14G008000 [Diphasiastrum complanatum]KAJ7530554.1 hypothetical protein O6H91_14G008000 [Diphasiastrum complanatum]
MERGAGGGVGGLNVRCGDRWPLRYLLETQCKHSDSARLFHVRVCCSTNSMPPSFICCKARMQTNASSFDQQRSQQSVFQPKKQQRHWHKEEDRRPGACQAALISYPPVTRAEKTLQLPIDYYQVLGAETHYLADAILRAYEARIHNPPTEGFSQEALVARQGILKAACDTLADPDMRGKYNMSLLEDEAGALVVEIPWSKMPGALCLLQEIGEMELVLQIGQTLLEERVPVPFKRDVALAMALAYVELSREAMTRVPPDVVQSCNLLESALTLLQEGGSSLAPALQEQINETLEEITPRCVLELLALPLDEHYKQQREDGLQGVRTILWEAGLESSDTLIGGFTREQFMQEAFSRMTAAEQVQLFTETPTDIPADPSEIYTVAYAHVAEGFTAKRPELIQAASNFFLELQEMHASNPGMAEDFPFFEVQDLALGRGMCELLLGKVESCKICLGLEDEKPLFVPILEFVQANSVQGEDGNLLGLCKLLEGWLAEEVLSKFRDTQGKSVKLHDFYDEPLVLRYLENLEKGGTSQLAAAAAIVRIGEGAGAALNSVKATLQKVFPLGKKLDFAKVLRQDHEGMTATSDYDPNSGISGNLDSLSKNGLVEESRQIGLAFPLSYAESVPQNKEFDPIKQLSRTSGNMETTLALPPDRHDTPKIPSLKKGLSPVQIACTGLLFGGVVMAGLRVLPVRGALEKFRIRSPVAVMEAATAGLSENDYGRENIAKMDARLAEDLVRTWQVAKSQALGFSHSIDLMHEILDGQMLKSWSERANNIAKHGWYWDYKLIGVNIDSVTISQDGKRALIEATLQEAACLFDNQESKQKDSYESTYTTRYEAFLKEGRWKIIDGVVLHS